MRALAAPLALIALAGTALAQSADHPAMAIESCACSKAEMLAARAAAGGVINDGVRPPFIDRELSADTDLLDCNLDIEIVPSTQTISGSNTMLVRSQVNNLTQFTFRLRTNYTISTLTVDGIAVAVPATPLNSYARTITLPHAYNAGQTFTVVVGYSGVAVSRGFGSIEFGTQNATDIVATLSEAYYAATWWPVKDGDVFLPGDNSDKFTLTLAVTAPSNLRTVSNGLLMPGFPQTLSGSRTKYRWRTNYQTAPYLACFSSTNYNTWSTTYTYPLTGGGTATMPVEFNIYPASDNANNRAAWEKCTQMMAAYRPYYGEYPFVNEKYGIYQFPFGGGMEHQTNTGQGTFDEGVTSHELGHQWWGDNVTCKFWNDIWLNEGFATYTEALWIEQRPGSTGLPAYLAAMLARKPNPVSDSVYVYDTSNMNRIFSSNYTYRKGGWALHQLRHVVGDATFYNILQTYRATFQGSAATTDDFANVASSVSGQDLSWFFRQWVYGIGAPAYTYGFNNVTIDGQNYLRLSITQTQDATWPGASAPAGYFRAPIDLQITTTAGPASAIVDNNARTQWFVIPVSAPATGLALDPSDWILNTGKTSAAYASGPAKIVAASPAPGTSLASAPASVYVTFSENVTVPAGAMTLTGPGGAVPATVAYAAGNFRATLTPTATLAPGTYTLTVAQTVTSAAGGAQLDGEYAASLPTGNGQPGGSAVLTFTIQAPPPSCDPDVNQDGNVDQDDVAYLINVVGGGSNPTNIDPDFNHDGNVDQDDIAALINVVAGGDCP